jgi:hypothetical protein
VCREGYGGGGILILRDDLIEEGKHSLLTGLAKSVMKEELDEEGDISRVDLRGNHRVVFFLGNLQIPQLL